MGEVIDEIAISRVQKKYTELTGYSTFFNPDMDKWLTVSMYREVNEWSKHTPIKRIENVTCKCRTCKTNMYKLAMPRLK